MKKGTITREEAEELGRLLGSKELSADHPLRESEGLSVIFGPMPQRAPTAGGPDATPNDTDDAPEETRDDE
jgi:hypothetical protein